MEREVPRLPGAAFPLRLTPIRPWPDVRSVNWQGAMVGFEGFLGADEPEASPGQPGLRLWFGAAAQRRAAIPLLESVGSFRVAELPEEPPRDWTAGYRAFFRGVEAGGFFIHPPTVPAHPTLPSLLLTPGAAFGTGVHPSTRLVLAALARGIGAPRPGRRRRIRVLDVGTGSGLLAVAAARLGAREVVAVDCDVDAVEAARAAARENGVAAAVRVLHGDFRDPEVAAALSERRQSFRWGPPDRHGLPTLPRWSARRFDWILGNLTAALAPRLATFAAARLGRRGRLIVSGVLRPEAGQVFDACLRTSLRVREILAEATDTGDLWVAGVLQGPSRPEGGR